MGLAPSPLERPTRSRRKLVSCLMDSRRAEPQPPPDASAAAVEAAAGASDLIDADGDEDGDEVAEAFGRCEREMKRWAASQRKKRRHERLRRQRPSVEPTAPSE